MGIATNLPFIGSVLRRKNLKVTHTDFLIGFLTKNTVYRKEPAFA